MITLRKYVDVVKAEMDKSLLEAAGIPAFIAGENSAAIGYGSILAEIHLRVEDADVERARQVLQDNNEATPLSDDFIPPAAPSFSDRSIPKATSLEQDSETEDSDTRRAVFSVVLTLLVVFAMFVAFRWWTLNGATFYYRRGVAKQVKGDFDGAIANYNRAIEINSSFSSAYYNRGTAKESKGELDAAIADYDNAIKLDPKNSRAYDNRGLIKRAKHDLDGAIMDFSQAIASDPGNANAYNNRALIRQTKGNLDDAIDDYDTAIDLKPRDAHIYNNRGSAKKAKGDSVAAITDFNRAIELDPKYVLAYLNRGFARRADGDLDGAIADYDKAIELAPKDGRAYFHRGYAKNAKGDSDGAILDYNRSIELDPKDVYAYDSRGFAKRIKGDLDGSVADYNKAIELDPKHASAYYSRGVARYDRREWSDALSDFRRASSLKAAVAKLEVLPDYTKIRTWMTRAKLGERAAATDELKQYLLARTIGKPGDWPSTIVRFLTTDVSESDFLKAADSGDEKQTRNQRCEAYFYVGTLRLLDGDKSGASDYFKKCLETKAAVNFEYQSAAAELEALKP